MGFEIELHDSGSSVTIGSSDIHSLSLPRRHSVINQWRAEVPRDLALEDWTGSEALFYYENEAENISRQLVYRGEYDRPEASDSSTTMTLHGKDTTRELKRGHSIQKTFESIPYWRAVQDYTTNELGWDWNVVEPTPEVIDSDKVVQDTTGGDVVSDVFTPSDTEPLTVTGGGDLTTLQTCTPLDVLDDYDAVGTIGFADDDAYNSGQAAFLSDSGYYYEFQITWPYDLPSEHVGIQIRDEITDSSNILYTWDGTAFDHCQAMGATLSWKDIGEGFYSGLGGYDAEVGQDLTAGTTYTLRIEVPNSASVTGESWTADIGNYVALNKDELENGSEVVTDNADNTYTAGTDYEMDYPNGAIKALSGGSISDGQTLSIDYDYDPDANYFADVIAVYDKRYNYNFANPDAATNGGGYLDGPETKPDAATIISNPYSSTFNIQAAGLTTAIDNISGSQRLRLSNDSTNYYPTDGSGENTESVSADFAAQDSYGTTTRAEVTLSRYGSRTGTLPEKGYESQTLSEFTLDVTTDDLAVLDGPRDYTGTHYNILQQLHRDWGGRFVTKHKESELAAESFRPGDVTKPLDVVTKDTTRTTPDKPYANSVTVAGGEDADGNTVTATAESQTAINNDGEVIPAPLVERSSLTSKGDLKSIARTELSRHLSNDDLTGMVEIWPQLVAPGYSYQVDELDGETLSLERVDFTYGARGERGWLDFAGLSGLATQLSSISANVE